MSNYGNRYVKQKKSSGGVVFLWLLMLAIVGVVGSQLFGPYKGWLTPFTAKVRDQIAEAKSETQHTLSEAKESISEAKERMALAKEKISTITTAPVETSDPKAATSGTNTEKAGAPISSVVQTSTMSSLPSNGESTPADLGMLESKATRGVSQVAESTPKKNSPTKQEVEPSTTPAPTTESVPSATAASETATESTEDYFEKMYQNFFDEEMSQLSKPSVGKKIILELKDGKKIVGLLRVLSRDRAFLKTSATEERTVMLQETVMSTRRAVFPYYFARGRALARMDRMLDEEAAKNPRPATALAEVTQEELASIDNLMERSIPSEEPETKTVLSPIVATTQEPEPVEAISAAAPSKLHPALGNYDASLTKTAKGIARPVVNFLNWLKYQTNRAGIPLASKLYAKQHGKELVLYMVISKQFHAQKKNLKEQTTEQFWRMWARQCREAGKISSLTRAHLVLVYDDKIVGGSREKDASAIWVK